MPLPNELLSIHPELQVHLETGDAWRDGDWTVSPDVLPLWILPLGALDTGAPEPPLSPQEVEHRLEQAGIAWSPCILVVGTHRVAAKALSGITRSKAVRLGYRLKRWCMIHVTSDRLNLVYTGLNSRVDG